MKKLVSVLLPISLLLLAGCVVLPVEAVPAAGFCPPGQAKKGNCRPEDDRGFSPPGQAKKGRC